MSTVLQDTNIALDTVKGISSIIVNDNGNYVEWGDFNCLVYYQKHSDIPDCMEVLKINRTLNKGDRVLYKGVMYDITERLNHGSNVVKIEKNVIETGCEELKDMGITIQQGYSVPVKRLLKEEDEIFVKQWMGVWARNIAKNYNILSKAKGIAEIHDACKGAVVAIVGAGPSLDKNIEELRDIKAIIIAVDRAYKPLVARGINPNLVVNVDCHDDIICGYLNNCDSRGHILVLNSSADWQIARQWRGKTLFYNMQHKGMDFCDIILPSVLPDFPAVANVGCVANTALIIADWIGSKEMILVGCDMSYPGQKVSCDEYDYINSKWTKRLVNENERFIARKGKILKNNIYTYPPFIDYVKTMAKLAERENWHIVNATEGGIIDCFENMTLKEAKTKYCSKDIGGMKHNLTWRVIK